MRSVFAFGSGGLFGLGLLISGMTDTTKVIGWLDIFGNWDPTLAFVLGGAIIPMFFAWRLAHRRAPKLGGEFPKPAEPKIGFDLAIGSMMFGVGWGLAGLCPGPAIASLGFGGAEGWLFFGAMSVGMLLAPTARKSLEPILQRA